METVFCPNCFGEMPINNPVCPHCQTDVQMWEAGHTFADKLVAALDHPSAEARMRAIITIANRRKDEAADALAQCAIKYPLDVVQSLAIIDALKQLPSTERTRDAFLRLTSHPARAVSTQAKAWLQRLLSTEADPDA